MNQATKDTNPKDAAAAGRIPLGNLSPIAKAHWALAQFSGMIKYGAWNWRCAGVRTSVYLSAMARHMDAYLSGEEFDPVDRTHHLGNIMACAAILLDAREAGKLTDDRPPVVGLRACYADLEILMARLVDQYKDKSPRHYTNADPVIPQAPRIPTRVGTSLEDMLATLQKGDVAMAPSQPGAIATALAQVQTVVHTETPDPEATSETIPSAPGPRHMTSIPVTYTDPDKDPPPSYAVEADPFPSAPDTQKSSGSGTVYVTPEHVVIPKDYHVLHMRSGHLVEEKRAEDAAEAWTTMTAYETFAENGDIVSVIKLGMMVYTKQVDK